MGIKETIQSYDNLQHEVNQYLKEQDEYYTLDGFEVNEEKLVIYYDIPTPKPTVEMTIEVGLEEFEEWVEDKNEPY